MKKLEKLSTEQEKIMIETKDYWINLALNQNKKGIDKAKFEKGINWLYTDLLKKDVPKIVYCDSWISCLIVIDIFKKLKKDSVADSVADSVKNSVWNSVWDSVADSVGDSVRNSVADSVRNSVWDSVADSVRNSVWDSVADSVGDSVGDSVRDSVWDSVGASVRNSVRDSVRNSVADSVRNSVWDSVADSVWDSVADSVWNSVADSVGDSVGDSVRDSVADSVGDSVGDSVWNSVWDSVADSVGDSVRNSVADSVRNSVWDSVADSVFREYSYYVGFIDYGWVSFYDFFTKIGIINNDKFNKYKEFTEANCFQTYCYENYVFAIQPPLEIIKNENGQLHNIKKAAVEFSDKTCYYFINGRNIPEPTFIKLKEDKYTIQDFIKEQNEEIKSTSIAYLQEVKGDDFLVTFFKENLKEINTFVDKKDEKYLKGTTNGMNVGVYTLFKGEINNTNIAYVRCYCPSTDRMFFLGVSSEYNNAKDAIASLYRIPKKLKPYIQEINRQGERFSTCLTKEGKDLIKNLPKNDIEDLISITGDEYFSKIKYEY